MNNMTKVIIVLALILSIAAVIIIKQKNKLSNSNQVAKQLNFVSEPNKPASAAISQNNSQSALSEPNQTAQQLPKLLDLGANKCIPCKMMKPILEELKTSYTGKLQVEFIDVWENQEAAKMYGINSIPTQIFFDASGKELFRHEGFMAKADILAKFNEMGINLTERSIK